MSAPFMPLYIAEYHADTTDLNRSQHGAYILLLMAMWRAGGKLPANDAKLAGLAKCTPKEWEAMRDIIMPFFKRRGGVITQKRLASEYAKYKNSLSGKSKGGKESARKKRLKNNENPSKIVESNLQQISTNKNHNNNKKKTLSPSDVSVISFEDFAEVFPQPDAINAGRVIWDELTSHGVVPDEIMAGLRAWVPVWDAREADPKDSFGKQHIRRAARWLTEEGWKDPVPVTDTPNGVPDVSIIWDGPQEVLRAVADQLGRDAARAYLELNARFQAPDTILTNTETAAIKLRTVGALEDFIIEKGAA